MIGAEPTIRVGLLEAEGPVRIRLGGRYRIGGKEITGFVVLRPSGDGAVLAPERGGLIASGGEMRIHAQAGARASVFDVPVGKNFHWEKTQEETFGGDLHVRALPGGGIALVNEIGLESYLASVISSEMNAAAPLEFLKAHAIASRSWLAAMLSRRAEPPEPAQKADLSGGEVLRWFEREDHRHYDVCADDHCQRYQGIPTHHAARAAGAVEETCGTCLVSGGEICDARYHKACGGLTERYATAWGDRQVPYLASIADGPVAHPPIGTEEEAQAWIRAFPEAYCNPENRRILDRILTPLDRRTGDFFRWRVEYGSDELGDIIGKKGGVDPGTVLDLVPLARGPSGRIFRLQVRGSRASFIVGKELEIRRLLSRSHLLSSAFAVERAAGLKGGPERLVLVGAGWGHGVGMCQVGAAVMADLGYRAEEILRHYFRGASPERLY